MSKFQVILIAVFVALAVFGVYIFATSSSGNKTQLVSIAIWGTLPDADVRQAINDLQVANKDTFGASYTYVPEADFQSKLVNAIATGQGPDLVLIPQDLFLSIKNLMQPIPYASYSQRLFQDSFAQIGEVFLAPDGIYALPVAIDPMVMFWNRDILSAANIALPPKTWTDVLPEVAKLTAKDSNNNLTQSAIAFGEWVNVPHAEEMLSTLMLQGGTPIVSVDQTTGKASPELLVQNSATGIMPASDALKFFAQFADPSQNIYSWNRSEPSADSAFLAGTLAFYFAPASETPSLRARNPNLNFDVAAIPQTGTTGQTTFADVYAFGVLKSSQTLSTDVVDASLLSGDTAVTDIATAMGIAPSRRDLLSVTPGQVYQAVYWQSALIADTFLDPSPSDTSGLFQAMIESVTSGSKTTGDAVRTANAGLGNLLQQVQTQ